jgi:signal transduction histidine kinase
MSHELRTPLNGVLGMTQLLMTTALTDEQQDYAAQIKLSTADLLRTINDLLDISKLETGRIDLENVEFNLGTLLHETLPALEMQARAKGLIFGYYLDPALPGRLRGDPRRLAQILANLVGNAIKFTDQGKVAVSLSAQTAAAGRSGCTAKSATAVSAFRRNACPICLPLPSGRCLDDAPF